MGMLKGGKQNALHNLTLHLLEFDSTINQSGKGY
jgi:hypothetical protein